MQVSVQQSYPIAHLPLVLVVLRRLEVATVIDGLIPYDQKIEMHQFSGRYRHTTAPPWACPVARNMCSNKAARCQGRHETPLPEHRDGVRRELRIVRHHGQTFLVRLGDEEAVEGIPVVQGKAVEGIDMLEGYRQDPETVHRLLLLEQDAQRLGKCQLAELDLDLDFPTVDDTEPYVIAQITESPIGCLRQSCRLVMPPQQSMGIEEQSHASPSQKVSGSGSSKSSAMTIVPCPRPAIRLRGCCALPDFNARLGRSHSA